MKGNTLPTNFTIDRGNLIRGVIRSWDKNSSQRRSSNARQLGCVFQDMTPPKSILRKCTDMRKSIHRVKFTQAIARHTKIRDQNPSLGYFCPGEPHERSPNAPKFEDRSQEETEWQEQGVCEAAWFANLLFFLQNLAMQPRKQRTTQRMSVGVDLEAQRSPVDPLQSVLGRTAIQRTTGKRHRGPQFKKSPL